MNPSLSCINILGFGTMGKQIASLFYLAGYQVYIWNRNPIDLSKLEFEIKKNKRVFQDWKEGHIIHTPQLDQLSDHITIESIAEDVITKKDLYESLKHHIKKPYFTNTSSLQPSEIGLDVYGLHFFNPISQIRLIELYLKPEVQLQTLLPDFHEFCAKNQFEIIQVKDNRGYLGNLLLFQEIANIFKAIETYHYSYTQINMMYRFLYPQRDIFKIIDLIGIDLVEKILKNLNAQDPTIYFPKKLTEALEKNILGKKNHTSITQLLF